MLPKEHLYIFVVLVLVRFIAADKCPPNEKIFPCTCQNLLNNAHVTCTNLQNIDELKKAVSGARGSKLYSIEIKDSNLGDLPGDIFNGTSLQEVKWSYTKLTSVLVDEGLLYAGLEDTLKRLTAIEVFWDYDKPLTTPLPMGHLKKLTYINSENNIIPKFGNEWLANGPESLKDLFLQTSLTKEVGDKAFAPLKNLRNLHFTGNSVTLKRSALPPNPIYLDSLDLSDNEIVEVPTDLFTNLPALKHLYLNNNALEDVPEGTFKEILRQLDFLFLSSNPLNCGAKMKWIFNGNLQEKIVGTCATPQALSGREIDSLTADDISG